MKMVLNRYSIEIVPESSVDEAFLEEVIGAHSGGPIHTLVQRVNVMATNKLAYLEIKRKVGSPNLCDFPPSQHTDKQEIPNKKENRFPIGGHLTRGY